MDLSFRERPDAELGGFCSLSARRRAVCVCRGVTHCLLGIELVLYSHCWLMCHREWRSSLAAQSLGGIVCHICHVKVWLRALSQRAPWAGPGDLLISHNSSGSDLLTNISTFHS